MGKIRRAQERIFDGINIYMNTWAVSKGLLDGSEIRYYAVWRPELGGRFNPLIK
jgi:hypothetical protein